MKKISICILGIILLGLAGNAAAVSPKPAEELLHGQNETVCIIHTVLIPEKGIIVEESSSTLVFEISASKKEVLEKVTRYINNKFNEINVSEFKLECKFQK